MLGGPLGFRILRSLRLIVGLGVDLDSFAKLKQSSLGRVPLVHPLRKPLPRGRVGMALQVGGPLHHLQRT